MPNVMFLTFNMFDQNGSLCIKEPPFNDLRKVADVPLIDCAKVVNHSAHMYQSTELYLVGDNEIFLEGLRDKIYNEYGISYSNDPINIYILKGE